MKVKKLGAGAIAVAGLAAASLSVGGAYAAASAADPACTADSTKLIETIPAVTHDESRYAKTVHHDAVGEPTVSVKVKDAVAEISHTDYVYRSLSGRIHLAHKDDGRVVIYDWVLYFRTGETTKHVVVPAQDAVFEDQPNPAYQPAYDETVYYTGKPGGSASRDAAAWVRYAPTGWPRQVATRTVTDTPEQYVCDVTRPVTTLTNPATPVQPSYVFDLETTDDHAVAKTVGNVYSGSTLVKSNQAPGGSLAVPADFPDGSYSLRYNGLDSVGNMASTGSFAFVVDGTGPTVTNKGTDAASYRSVSFKLFDAHKVDRFTLNDYAGDLSDNTWSDLNDIHPGWYGAKEGANTLTVYDVAGNATTVTFTLDTTGPTITDKGADGASAPSKSFKLFDASSVDKVDINGVVKDLSDNTWSDVNGIKPGVFGGVEGTNTITAYDVLGNATTKTFVLDTTAPTVTNKGTDATSYRSVSFKLFDANKVDRFTLNDYAGDLSDNTWSDLNDIHPGWYGAKEGANALTVYDVAGNATTVTFTLDTSGPQVTEKDDSSDASRSFKLYDPSKAAGFSLNGHDYDLADNVWSDLNSVTPGRYGAVAGENTLVVRDVLGNETTVTFTLQ